MDRNQEYLRLVQERNRMKKAATEKTPEELQKEELEKGFSINFRGANAPKQAPSKALDKPVVKVQKGLSADIARRLLGGGDDADQSVPVSKKRWTVDVNDDDEPSAGDEPRSRSASAHRRRKSASEEVTPRNDEISTNSHGSGQARSTKKSAAKGNGKEKGKVDDVLLQRIKSMTAEQKKALLDLLQIPDPTLDDDDGEDDDEGDNEGGEGNEESDNEEAMAHQFTGRKAEATDAMHLIKTASEEDAVITASEVTPTNAKNDSSSRERPVSSSAPSYDWSLRKFNIRVKIFSTWDDCKNCVLQAIRCRLRLPNGQYVDLLPALKAQ
eukprot:gene19913-23648_t